MDKARIVIADDDARFRQRVRTFLAAEPRIEVVAEVGDGQEAVRVARTLGPDLVLMDVGMPVMNGFDATHQLKAEMPLIGVIMLTIHELEEYRRAADVCGVDRYIVKRAMFEELLPAIHSLVPSLCVARP
jgi:DNA-binding NarL/FixJ family response regulator